MENWRQNLLKPAKRILIKVGTHVLSQKKGGLDTRRIGQLVDQIATLATTHKKEVVLVSSGAIGAGMNQMGLVRRPTHVPEVQALACKKGTEKGDTLNLIT